MGIPKAQSTSSDSTRRAPKAAAQPVIATPSRALPADFPCADKFASGFMTRSRALPSSASPAGDQMSHFHIIARGAPVLRQQISDQPAVTFLRSRLGTQQCNGSGPVGHETLRHTTLLQ